MSRFYNEERQKSRRRIVSLVVIAGLIGIAAIFLLSPGPGRGYPRRYRIFTDPNRKFEPIHISGNDAKRKREFRPGGKIALQMIKAKQFEAAREKEKKKIQKAFTEFIGSCVLVVNPDPKNERREAGFLYKTTKTRGYIVTHPFGLGGRKKIGKYLSVVFYFPGGGRKEVRARVENKQFAGDFVLLSVPNKNLPKPLSRIKRREPDDNDNVGFIGYRFLFGYLTPKNRPIPSVRPAYLRKSSSVHTDMTRVFDIKWDTKKINPRDQYALGPAMSIDRAWVGVAVRHQYSPTKYFLVSHRILDKYWDGKITGAKSQSRLVKQGHARVSFSADVANPARMITEVGVYVVPDYIAGSPNPVSRGYFQLIPGAEDRHYHRCRVKNNKASASIDLRRFSPGEKSYRVQVAMTYADGTQKYLEPGMVRVRFWDKDPQTQDVHRISEQNNKPVQAWDIKSGLKLASNSSRRTVIDDMRTYPGFHLTFLNFPRSRMCHKYLWARSGKSFYALNKKGILYHISVPDFRILKEIYLGTSASDIALSRRGPVVMLNKAGKAVLVDVASSRIKAVFDVPEGFLIFSSPALDIAFASKYPGSNENLFILDVKRKQVIGTVSSRSFGKLHHDDKKAQNWGFVLREFNYPTVTPDGKYLLCGGNERLHRFRIRNRTLVFDEVSPEIHIGERQTGPMVSPDGRYVGVVSRGKFGKDYHVSDDHYYTAVFKIEDFSRPVLMFKHHRFPSPHLRFDKSAGFIYSASNQPQLKVYSPGGQLIKEYTFFRSGEHFKGMLLHPGGKQMLMASDYKYVWIKIPGATKAARGKNWIGENKPPTDRLISSSVKLKVTAPKKSLVGAKKKFDNLNITQIGLPAPRLLRHIQWAGDYRSFYAASKDGVIYRVSVPDFDLIQRFRLGEFVSDMKWSSEGLVLVLDRVSEVRVLDTKKLRYKTVIPVPGAKFIAASPVSPYGFVTRRKESNHVVLALDLRGGKMVETYRLADLWKEGEKTVKRFPGSDEAGITRFLTFSPDGKSLLGMCGGSLVRYSLTGSKPKIEEVGPDLRGEMSRLEISPDSQIIVVLGDLEHGKIKGHPSYQYGAYFYRPRKLSKPVIAIQGRRFQDAWGFDARGSMIYGHDHSKDLITYSLTGDKIKEYKFCEHNEQTRAIAVFPHGKKLLLLTEDRLFWVEIK